MFVTGAAPTNGAAGYQTKREFAHDLPLDHEKELKLGNRGVPVGSLKKHPTSEEKGMPAGRLSLKRRAAVEEQSTQPTSFWFAAASAGMELVTDPAHMVRLPKLTMRK